MKYKTLYGEKVIAKTDDGCSFTLRRVGWMIMNGRVALPFSVKETRASAISSFIYDHLQKTMSYWWRGKKEGWLDCVPVYEDLSND